MRRRRFIAALGASLPIAGCLGSESPGTPTPGETTVTERTTTGEAASSGTATTASETTTTPSETTADPDPEMLALGETFRTPEGGTVTVHDARVRRTVYTQYPHVTPVTWPGKQFVVADATVSDRELFRKLSVAADGSVLDAGATEALAGPFAEPEGELFGVSVPAPLDAERAALVWFDGEGAADEEAPTARWPLSAEVRRALANPPKFSVEAFAVPEEVERWSPFTASLTVANSGSGDGAFRAELGATTLSDTPDVRVEVPAGETVSAERTVEPHYSEESDELTVRLNWGAGAIERTVAVV